MNKLLKLSLSAIAPLVILSCVSPVSAQTKSDDSYINSLVHSDPVITAIIGLLVVGINGYVSDRSGKRVSQELVPLRAEIAPLGAKIDGLQGAVTKLQADLDKQTYVNEKERETIKRDMRELCDKINEVKADSVRVARELEKEFDEKLTGLRVSLEKEFKSAAPEIENRVIKEVATLVKDLKS